MENKIKVAKTKTKNIKINNNSNNNDDKMIIDEKLKQERNELLFWSIFRNCHLNRKIFTGSKFRLDIYNYYEINNVQWMLKNKYYQLLWEKVSKSETNLIFESDPTSSHSSPLSLSTSSNKIIITDNELNPIFKHFKKDLQFFLNFYQNFNHLFTKLTKFDKENLYLKNDNVAALVGMIKLFNYVPTFNAFKQSIEIGSLEVSNYLYNQYGFKLKLTVIEKDEIWRTAIGYRSSLPNTSDYHEIYNNKVEFFIKNILSNDQKLPPPLTLPSTFVQFNPTSSTSPPSPQITNINDNGYTEELKKFKGIYNFKINEKSIGLILNCCKTVLLLLENQKVNIVQQLINDGVLISMGKLDEMKLKFIENGQLDQLISTTAIENSDVKSLYTMILHFTENISTCNTIFYQLKYFGTSTGNNNQDDFGGFNPIEFGIYRNNSIIKNWIPITFRFCTVQDKSIRILPFFKNAISDINDTKLQYNNKFSKKILFECCLHFGDMELIQYVYNELYVLGGNIKFSIDYQLIFSIKQSPEIFDFLFNNSNDQDKLEYLKLMTSNYKLSTHFKNKYPIEYFNSVSKIPSSLFKFSSGDSLKFVFENYKDFTIDQFDITKRWSQLLDYHCKLYPKQSIESIYSSLNKFPSTSIPYIFNNNNGISSILITYNYIMDYRSDDIDSGKFQISTDKFLLVEYLRGNLQDTIQLYLDTYQDKSQVHQFTPLLNELVKRNDLTSIEFLISTFKNDNNTCYSNFIIQSITLAAKFNNQLKIIEFINKFID